MSILRHSTRIFSGGLFLLAAFGFVNCQAQTFPSRPIVLIYPYASGSPLEGAYRVVLGEAGRLLGQPYLIESRPGANGRLGMNAIKEAKPDGYVTTLGSDTNLVLQPMEEPAAYKVEMYKDYTPIVFLSRSDFIVVAHPSVAFRDIKGLIAYAKANPKKLNWASAPGSTTTQTSLRIQKAAGFEATMIPYKGAGETAAALLGGQVDMYTSTPATFRQYVDQGKIIALAVTGKQRSPALPSVPTLTEAGLAMPPMGSWFGVISPGGTPPDVVAKLYNAVRAGVVFPEAAKLFTSGGYFPEPSMTTNDYVELIKSEVAAWK